MRHLLHLQRFPDSPRPLPRPCDHGVNLCEHSRCQRRAANEAVDADGGAEKELDEGVFHEMPHLFIRYDSTVERLKSESAVSYMTSSHRSH